MASVVTGCLWHLARRSGHAVPLELDVFLVLPLRGMVVMSVCIGSEPIQKGFYGHEPGCGNVTST